MIQGMTKEQADAKLVAALERAQRDQLVVYRNADGSFDVPGSKGNMYSVRAYGPLPLELTCTCLGSGAWVCKHRAAVVWARKYHTFAERVSEDCGQLVMAF